MQLYLIRHAESENNAKPPEQRVSDPSITDVGWKQTACLAAWTKTLKIDTLITSPFRRALDTTIAILDAQQQHLCVWHDTFERGGCYHGYHDEDTRGATGMGRSEILSHLNRAPNQCTIDKGIDESGWWGEKDKETDQQASERAQQVTGRLQETFGANGPTVVIVTHADFKRLLLEAMLPGVLDPHLVGPMRNTGISKVNFDGKTWQLDWLNSVSHLPADLITGNEA